MAIVLKYGPLVIINRDGLSQPHFRCQICGRTINSEVDAMLLWHPDQPTAPIVVCKCYECLDKRLPHSEREQYPFWQELTTTIIYLANNCIGDKKAQDQARQTAALLSQL